MSRLYISHALDDYDLSKNLADCLRDDGAEIWIHYGKLEVNGDLPEVLKKAIDCCDTFVLVWSKQALHSRCVKLECKTAVTLKKTIIPCLLDDTKQSIMIRNFHCIDFNNFEQGFDQLTHTLKKKEGEIDKKCFSDNIERLAEPVLISSIFRNKPKRLSEDDVKDMLKNNDFFDKNRNKIGHGFTNQFEIQKINHDKVILDYNSGLMWQQGGSYESRTFKQVKSWIEELNRVEYANYHDWRLPTLEEAMSLMRKEMKNGGLFIDPIFDQTQKWIWTSDLTQSGSLAWVVFFNYGSCYVNCFDLKNYIRAVRSGQLSQE